MCARLSRAALLLELNGSTGSASGADGYGCSRAEAIATFAIDLLSLDWLVIRPATGPSLRANK